MGLGNLLLIPGLGSSTALDIRASVGTSTSPTTTGTKAVTGVGFQPKVVMPFANLQDAVGTATTILMNVGAATSPSVRACIAAYSQSGVTTTNTRRRHDNAKLLSQVSATGTDFLVTDLASIDSDGFTYNYSAVDPLARILNHICLGGADLEASLTQHQMNATNAPQSFAHGLSGAPTGIMLFSTGIAGIPPATNTQSEISLGFYANGSQFSAGVISRDALTTTRTSRILNTGFPAQNTSAATFNRFLNINSVDTTNVNCTYSGGGGTVQAHFWMLAIRGAKCQTGTFDCNGSLSPLTINTPGITPKLFLPVFVPTGVDSINTVLNELFLTIGASDGVNNVSCGITDTNAQTTTNARRSQSSTSLSEYATDGTIRSVMTAGFSGESVVLTPTTMVNNAFGQGAYLVVGA